MSLYKLQIYFLDIYERIKYKRCEDCEEIVFDGICDYCEGV